MQNIRKISDLTLVLQSDTVYLSVVNEMSNFANLPNLVPRGLRLFGQRAGAVTVIWVSPCFGYPHTQITSDMGIPGGDAQNTDSFHPNRLGTTRA